MSARTLIPSINGLRAISIIIVVLSHWAATENMPEELRRILHFMVDGSMGVRVFFEISGFLITYLLLKEYHKNGRVDLMKFYIRRFLRIFPVFYAYLLFIICLKYLGIIEIEVLSIIGAFLYIENFKVTPFNWLTGHSWSLAVEEQFYLIWPAVFKYFNKVSVKYVVGSLMLGAFMRSFYYKYTVSSKYFLAPFLMHADFLLMGCFLGILYYQKSNILDRIKKLRSWHLLVITILMWFFTHMEYHPVWDKLFIPASGVVVALGVAIIFIYAIESRGRLYAFLNQPWIEFVGKLSYSIYVWQQLFLGGAYLFAAKFKWVALFPQNIIFVMIFPLLSYWLVEKPFLRIKDNMSRGGKTPEISSPDIQAPLG